MGRSTRSKTAKPEPVRVPPGITPYSLRLYVAGSNLKSTQAVQIVQKLCGLFPPGRCTLEVVDLYQEPSMAKQDNILAVPSLIKISPPPRRAFVGITTDTDRILQKLGIPIASYGRQKPKN